MFDKSKNVHYHCERWTENNQKFLGEHKVITAKQQFQGLFFYLFISSKWLWLLYFFVKML